MLENGDLLKKTQKNIIERAVEHHKSFYIEIFLIPFYNLYSKILQMKRKNIYIYQYLTVPYKHSYQMPYLLTTLLPQMPVNLPIIHSLSLLLFYCQ